MNWVITGGCGFLGTALIRRLIQESGHSIRVIDNLSTGTREDLESVTHFNELEGGSVDKPPVGVELVVSDVMDERIALSATRGCEIVVHLAANTGVRPSVDNPRLDMYTNVVGTFNYLEAARINRISRFIFASSGAPAGEVEPPIHEELPPHPVSPYGASKLAGEGYCSAYKRTFGLDTVALRFGNVYGPGSTHKASVVATFIRRAIAGQTLEIYGDGRQTRDFIYIDDLIDAVILAARKTNIGGEIFQIASSRETTIEELAEKLGTILTATGYLNTRIAKTDSRPGDVRRNFSDTAKAKLLLGWEPRITLEEGLHKTVAYFLNLGLGESDD